jgi:hypothetical protein
MPKPIEYVIAALTAWREDRSASTRGMTAVLCVLRNRVAKHGSDYYRECTKPWAFSSITAHGDSQLSLWPAEDDPTWVNAQQLAQGVIDGTIADITGGSTLYYAPASIPAAATIDAGGKTINWPVNWNKDAVRFFGWIGDQVYFVEL